MFIKTMTVENFYTVESASSIMTAVSNLPTIPTNFGDEIPDFNMVADDADDMFSAVLNKKVIVNKEKSGVFRFPRIFVHFEDFQDDKDWCFAVALDTSMFNVYEHESGARTALDGYKFNYRDMFEWNLISSNFLYPGQAIFFRPWLFHSFDTGLIQTFRLKEE